MSVWYNSSVIGDSNICMYRGDYGEITVLGLPDDKKYRAYFSIKSIKTGEILLETSADTERYWAYEDNTEIEPYDDEDYYEYNERCTEMSEEVPPRAFRKRRCKFILTAEMTSGLPMMSHQETVDFYFGIKICCLEDGDEDTLVPAVEYDDEKGEYVFKDAPHFILRQKYVEGILPFKQYCDMDEAEKRPEDYGLQPLLSEGEGISISENNVISTNTINNLKNIMNYNPNKRQFLYNDSGTIMWVDEE